MVATLMGIATVLVSLLAATSRSGGHRFKTEGAPHFPLSPLFTPSPLSRVLSLVSRCSPSLVVLVLRRGRAVCAGRVLGLSGAGRRHSFLREGPNGVFLHMEVGILAPLALSMPPSPLWIVFLVGLRVWLRPPRQCRDQVERRDKIATARCIVTSIERQVLVFPVSVFILLYPWHLY
ncbi:hypothetical protein Taro_046212 [Colocasia esculenta]|uniref:Secreted protein n=1 Tax=Colocasia esculenta TaxID=4460 RepID=A0A843X775_COLES|nr:hypothetical protein [Colocasia esculenta]